MENEEQFKEIYGKIKTIAVVGASSDPSKPSHTIPRYLQKEGYKIIPVSPKGGEILGEKVYSSLSEVPEKVDAVNVFRPSAETPEIARQARDIGAKVLWLQTGIQHEEAEKIAKEAGMDVVMNMCMGTTHKRLGLGSDY